MMCKLKGRMDKEGHYDVETEEGGCKKGALLCANEKGNEGH